MSTLVKDKMNLCCVLIAFLASCSVPTIPTSTPATTLLPPTSTPTSTAVSSIAANAESPTLTSAPSPTSLTHTPRPIPTPGPTLVPTMTSDEEYTLVSEMLRDNGGCRLPCWWGFTPGETHWQTVDTFFASLGKRTEVRRHHGIQRLAVLFAIPDHLHYQHYHTQSYQEKDDVLDMVIVHAVPPADEEGYPLYEDPQFVADWKVYMLPQMLNIYEQPSQVLLSIYRSTPWTPFDLLLFYPEKGILIQYSGPAERGEETFRVCPHQSEITLYLWVPEQYANMEDVPGVDSHSYAADEVSGLHSLEDAIGMNIEQFYQAFAQLDGQTCLETSIDIW